MEIKRLTWLVLEQPRILLGQSLIYDVHFLEILSHVISWGIFFSVWAWAPFILLKKKLQTDKNELETDTCKRCRYLRACACTPRISLTLKVGFLREPPNNPSFQILDTCP